MVAGFMQAETWWVDVAKVMFAVQVMVAFYAFPFFDAVVAYVMVSSIFQVCYNRTESVVHERLGYDEVVSRKVARQAWQLAAHASFGAAELFISSEHSHTPLQAFEIEASHVLQFVYLLQAFTWIYTCEEHLFSKSRAKDKDDSVMLLHHLVTIGLILGSQLAGFQVFGGLVLLVHDVPDVLVDVLKIANYMKLEGPGHCFAVEISFGSMVACFAYYRLWCFGWLCSSAWVAVFTQMYPPTFAFFPLLLSALLGMHVYWFGLFMRIAGRLLVSSPHEAGTAEYHEE